MMSDEQIRELASRHADDALVGVDAFVRASVRGALESAVREALESAGGCPRAKDPAKDRNAGQFVVLKLGQPTTDHRARTDANYIPHSLHDHKGDAIFEARRLAARSPGDTFAVFQRIGQALVPEQKARFEPYVGSRKPGTLSRLLGLHLGSKQTAAPASGGRDTIAPVRPARNF